MNDLFMHPLTVTRLNMIVKQITHALGPIQTTNICGTNCVAGGLIKKIFRITSPFQKFS